MENRIKIYTAVRMTGRMCDEMVDEAGMLTRTLYNHGYEALSPVTEERIPYVHETLPLVDLAKLMTFWRRDKEMIRDADIILDYNTVNASDGAVQEIGYSRWCLWKPTIRVVTRPGFLISRIEDDLVVDSLAEAMLVIRERFGSYAQLKVWREEMWKRSFPKWFNYQMDMHKRYGCFEGRMTWEVS